MSAKPLLILIEIAAVFVSALSGLLEARKKNMDLVGAYAVALITAFGGGTLRDLLLDRRPLFWVEHQYYPVLILAGCIVGVYAPRLVLPLIKYVDLPDALGLGLFSITGAYYALQFQPSLFVASLFGVITGVFGGVLRDVVCNEIPQVFGHTTLYATCSFAGSWVYLLGLRFGLGDTASAVLGFAGIFVLRMLAIRFNLQLPRPAGTA